MEYNNIILTTLIGLVLTAYSIIWKSTQKTINERMKKIEQLFCDLDIKQERINPIMLTIQTSLAEIKKDLEWLKRGVKQ